MAARLWLAAALLAVCGAVEVMIPMRDGIKLHTCFDFPIWKELKNLTAIMDRSPYGQDGIELIADIYLLLGFVAVRQDMRGTGKSEGNFSIWHKSGQDAYDTMEYISRQSWSNGHVVTVGASADGIAQFTQPIESPPWLSAQFIIFATSRGRAAMYPGGGYRKELVEHWLNGTVPDEARALIEEVKSNEAPGPWWNPINDTGNYEKVDFPSVHWAGWYDIFLIGSISGYDGYQKLSAPSARGHAQLVIDPLGHCQAAAKYFPKNLIAGRVGLPVFLSFDMYKGKRKLAEHVKNLTFYIMGATGSEASTAPGNYWTTLEDWPAFTPTDFYLAENGALAKEPGTASSQTYTYDPTNPVPTVGGNNLFLKCGPLDQSEVETRDDVLLFETDALASPLAVTGPLVATLFVGSSANDTDFTVKLTDVYPDGKSLLIQDGIVRMRWRNDASSPVAMEPGKVYEAEVTLWNTSFVWNKGHKIRVAISSSNYPRFSANPNTGVGLIKEEHVAPISAQNTVYFGAGQASRITLPVVDLANLPPIWILEPTPKDLESVVDVDPEHREMAAERLAELVKSLIRF